MDVKFQGVRAIEQHDKSWKVELTKTDHPTVKPDELHIVRRTHRGGDGYYGTGSNIATFIGYHPRIAEALTQPYTQGELTQDQFAQALSETLSDIAANDELTFDSASIDISSVANNNPNKAEPRTGYPVGGKTLAPGRLKEGVQDLLFRFSVTSTPKTDSEGVTFIEKGLFGKEKTTYDDEILSFKLNGSIDEVRQEALQRSRQAKTAPQKQKLDQLLSQVPAVNKFLKTLLEKAQAHEGSIQYADITALFEQEANPKQLLKQLKIFNQRINAMPDVRKIMNERVFAALQEATIDLERFIQKERAHP